MAQVLETVRARVSGFLGKDTSLQINRGFSCVVHNAEIPGAAKQSRHCVGDAVDVACPFALTEERLAEELMKARREHGEEGGIGLYNGRVHMDFRGTFVKWDVR
jgi:uncharacterized protein YcbK (DUF882 family)